MESEAWILGRLQLSNSRSTWKHGFDVRSNERSRWTDDGYDQWTLQGSKMVFLLLKFIAFIGITYVQRNVISLMAWDYESIMDGFVISAAV